MQCLVINLGFIDSETKRFSEALDDCWSLKQHLATSWTIFGRAAKGKKMIARGKRKIAKGKKGVAKGKKVLRKAKQYCTRQNKDCKRQQKELQIFQGQKSLQAAHRFGPKNVALYATKSHCRFDNAAFCFFSSFT